MKKSILNLPTGIRKDSLSFAASALLLSLGALAPTAQLQAQETESSSDANQPQIEEIIVTARNRTESIQDVPLAITAFTKEDLEIKSISNLDDVARFTPGLSFEDFSGGFATPVIRGQAQTSITALEQNTAAFFDGLYIPRSWAVDIGTSNVDRIEVVKGPQSARYGRNAFSGAINYVPSKASLGNDELYGKVETTFGSDERQDFGVYLEMPFNDKFAGAISYNTSEFDGSWENAHPFANASLGDERSTNGNLGGWDNTSFSASLAAQVTDKWDFDLAFYNFEQKNEARAGRNFENSFNTDVFNCGGTFFGNDLLICGDLPDTGDTATVDPRGYGIHSDTDIIRFSTSYDINEKWDVSYTYGGIDGNTDIGTPTEPDPVNCGSLLGPPAFAALCNFQTAPIGGIDYESHEVRFKFEGDSLFGAFGIYGSDGQDDFQFFSFNIAPLLDPNNFVPLAGQNTDNPPSRNPGPFNVGLRDELTDTDVAAIFGEVQYALADGVTRLGAEVRYSETEVSLLNRRPATPVGFAEEFKAFTPRFTYERDINEDRLAYATIARGAKTGGFNSGAVAVENQTFDEEFNWTYEAGLKNSFLNGRLNANAAVFYTDWTDIQVNAADPDSVNRNASNIVLNLGNADAIGIEIDTIFQATDNVSLDATFSHVNATYGDGTTDQRFARNFGFGSGAGPICDDVVCNISGDVSDNDIERTPQTQLSLGAQYDGVISNSDYYIRGDLSWQSAFYASSVNIAEIPSRTLLNLRGGVKFDNGFGVSAWVKNLADEEYVSNAFVVITRFNNQYGSFYGDRRTIGLTASYEF